MSDLKKIRWVEFPNSNNRYTVSEDGEIYGLYRNKMLKPKVDKDGYLHIGLYINKKVKHMRVHRVVAIAFMGDKGLEYDVDHIDRNRANNKLSNLRWIKKADHFRDRISKGFVARGSNHGRSKYPEETIIKVISDIKEGALSLVSISEKHNVKYATVHKIYSGKHWKCISGL